MFIISTKKFIVLIFGALVRVSSPYVLIDHEIMHAQALFVLFSHLQLKTAIESLTLTFKYLLAL